MRKKLVAGLLSVAMLVSSVPGVAMAEQAEVSGSQVMAEIYVSAGAEPGTGNGSEDAPYASMDEARQAVQGLNDNMTGDIVVYFDDGEYLLDSTVAFNQEDSASNGYKIIYKAVDPGKAVITSGLQVTGWEDANDADRPGLLAADADIENTRQFYVDGEMAVRAKGKIKGEMVRSGEKTTYTTYNGNHDAYTGFRCANTDILNWRNPENIEFIWDISWAHRISPVTSITKLDDNNSFIEMEWDSFKTGQIAGGVQINRGPDYVENAYELLDEPGEWYFDSQEKKIYYMPKAGQDMSQTQAIIPSVENLITLEGTLDESVSDISFEGFGFSYNTWLYPSAKGWPEQQANFAHDPREDFNMHAYSLAPGAAIVTKMAKGITFDRCTFQNLGSAGINMLDGSVGNTVQNSVFKDISAGGVLVGGVSITEAHPLMPGDTIENHIKNKTPHDERLIVKDNRITNNYFNGIGTEYKGSIAVVAGYTDGTVITNNTIRDVAYSGISVGWGWGFWDQGGRYKPDGTPDNETPAAYPVFPLGDAAVSCNNIIENNDIFQCMMKLHDGAGIYTLGDMPGSSIKGNLIHDNVGWPGGIYLDEGSGGMTVDQNITYNVQVDLNHNVREHTYGYKADHYVDGGNNFYGVSPDNSRYPAELAANAGVQEDGGEIIIPIELNKLTAPEFISSGDKVLLEGNFGSETGRVVLSGTDGPVYLDAQSGNIISWTAKKILLRMPGGIVSGSVYVESANGVQSNAKKINVGNFTEELFKDDFEDYEAGKLADQQSAANRYTAIMDSAYVEENEDGTQFLRIHKSGGADARLEKDGEWQDVMLSMDFRYDVNPQDFGGFFLSPRFKDHGNMYLVLLTPNYTNGLGYQQYVDGSLNGPGGGGKYSYHVGTWYSTKIAIVGQEMKVKVWEKGKPEPSLWTSSTTFSGIDKGGLMVQLTSLRDGEKASIDNLCMYGYQSGVTEDVSADREAPVSTAVLTGNRNTENKEIYNSQVQAVLSAEDNGSGIADIEYRLDDGEFISYTEPLLFGLNGDYVLSYRAVDRAGNTEKTKTIRFTVDLQPGDLIFEDNFEEYETGKLNDLDTKGYTAINGDAIEIEEQEAGKLLKLNGIGQDVRLIRRDNWENTVMTFDYLYQNPLGGLEGLYPSNYFQNLGPDSMYAYPMLPGWGGILLQQNVNGNANNITGISNDDYPVQPNTWYTVKMQTSNSHMAIKIWNKDLEEPENWMAERDVSGLNGGGGLYFSFSGKAGENAAYIDNVEVRGFQTSAELTRVLFEADPQNATVSVSGQEPEADGSYLLPSGAYTYTVSAEGYMDLTGTLDVNGEITKSIYTALQREPVSREQLDQLIEQACAITDDQLKKYTDDSVKAFKNALEAAVKLSEDAFQPEIDAAAQALDAAMKGLTEKPPVHRDQLNTLIQQARGITAAQLLLYTDESVRVFKNALEAAVRLSENASQAEVDAAARALDGAIKGLTKKPETNVPQPIDVSKLSIGSIARQTHTGRAIKPTVTVRYGSKVLRAGTDYTLTYKNNVNPGKAQLILTGKGSFKGSVTKTFIIAAKKGKIYNVGNYQYRVLNSSVKSGTVRFLKPIKKNVKKATIPSVVTIGNYKYKVTEVGKYAFKNNKKITSVVIEKNVTKINASAFYGAKNLKKITVKSKVLKSVGKNAFKNIHAKASIKVPSSKLKKYKQIMANKGQGKRVTIKK